MANIVGWVVLGLFAGWVVAWLIRGRLANDGLATAQADARAKQEQLKRDSEARAGRFENDLHDAKEIIQKRDNAIAERDRLIRQQTDQLAAGLSQLTTASAERDHHQAKVEQQGAAVISLEQNVQTIRSEKAGLEQRLAQLQPLPAKLAAAEMELRETKTRLKTELSRVNSQDQEISTLHKRNVELEPLTVQVKDRRGRMLELENRLAESVRTRDTEIVQLKKRLSEIEVLPQRLADAEAKRAQVAGELNAMRRAKDEEVESLQLELRAIPELQRRLVQRDGYFLDLRERDIDAQRKRDWDGAALKSELARRDAELDLKDSTIGRLHQQLAELAPLPEALANHSLRALELERGVAQREEKLRLVLVDVADLRARLESLE